LVFLVWAKCPTKIINERRAGQTTSMRVLNEIKARVFAAQQNPQRVGVWLGGSGVPVRRHETWSFDRQWCQNIFAAVRGEIQKERSLISQEGPGRQVEGILTVTSNDGEEV
jgi:hypothetical protein